MKIRALVAVLLIICCLGLGLTQAQISTGPVVPGVWYTAERLEEGPWEVRVIRVERGAPGITLEMALGQGAVRGVEPLSKLVARVIRERQTHVVAGINADYFVMEGNPWAGEVTGLAIQANELIMTARGQPAFVVMADGTPRIGVFNTAGELRAAEGVLPVGGVNQEAREGTVTLCSNIWGFAATIGCAVLSVEGLPLRPNGTWRGTVTEVIPPGTERSPGAGELLVLGQPAQGLAPGEEVEISLRTEGLEAPVAMAVGGGPVLLREGNILLPDDPADPRHPRTAVGYNQREIVLMTVDGRQPGWSVGTRHYETARLLQSYGCTEGLNLDGGGSTTAWVAGEVVNRPSGGKERPIANAVLVQWTPPGEPASPPEGAAGQ